MKQYEMTLVLPEPNGKSNKTQFVLGSTGSGKTTLISNMLLEIKRWITFDTRSEYSPEFFGENTAVVTTPRELVDALNRPAARIIYRLEESLDMDTSLNLAMFKILDFQALNVDKLGNLTIALDELNRFASSKETPIPGLKEIVQRGRARGIEKLFGAQWFNSIPTWVRDSFTELWVFRHNDPNGVNMLERYGIHPDVVETLERFTVLHVNGDGVSKVKLIGK